MIDLRRVPVHTDARGSLWAGDFAGEVPFMARRYFVVSGVPGNEIRGDHAHRKCHQFLLCVRGSVTVDVDDGTECSTVVLDDPGAGLYLPPLTWTTQRAFSADAVLLVFASDPYDRTDYVDDHDEYLRLLGDGP